MARQHQHQSAVRSKHPKPGQLSSRRVLSQPAIHRPEISKRDSSTSSSTSSKVCTSNDKSAGCGKPSETNNNTLPIVLGIVIPLIAALVLFYFLHRRHVKKLRREDANDPHKSLDFGMGSSILPSARKKKEKETVPETTAVVPAAEKGLRRERGMSMDISSPYVLPPGLQSSSASLHSLSRTINSGDDRYRPATTLVSNDTASMRSHVNLRRGADDTSSYAGSGISGRTYANDSMKQNLLHDAQRMSRSLPPSVPNLSNGGDIAAESRSADLKPEMSRKPVPLTAQMSEKSPATPMDHRDWNSYNGGADVRNSNSCLGPLIDSKGPSTEPLPRNPNPVQEDSLFLPASTSNSPRNSDRNSPPSMSNKASEVRRPPRLQSLNASSKHNYASTFPDDASNYGDPTEVIPSYPKNAASTQELRQGRQVQEEAVHPANDHAISRIDDPSLGYDIHRLSMGFRPLPPDDPADNPEQRANRIRSFYKEYFDDSKPSQTRAPGDYIEDYDQGYLGDGAMFDPATGQFATAKPQFAEPYARRAMTPPPRAPPRFQGPARHQATMSGGGFTPRGARAFSSASGRLGPSGRGPLRAAVPPPGPLRVLPSPHLLKEDSFVLPIDFAPPTSYKDRQAGRPGSPRGGMRPYSPALPAHLPLASSFDDLSVMPSPHSLRRSGTFTALDFAPPPKFKSSDNGSDSGSIRSNRSAMSAQQLHSIRSGAYRVSRIPKEVVGTKTEINESLKPQWTMRDP